MYMIQLNTMGKQQRNESKYFTKTHETADLNNVLHYSANQHKLVLDGDASLQPVVSYYKTGPCWHSTDCIWFNAIPKKLVVRRQEASPM